MPLSGVVGANEPVGLCSSVPAVDPPPDGGYPGGNTAKGTDALFNLTTGYYNTANGVEALFSNTSGNFNTATGFALVYNTTGSYNTATGGSALQHNTTGNSNTATGVGVLNQLTTGSSNTVDGQGALHNNTTGSSNIALGFQAGANLTIGSNNIEIGNVGVAGDANMIRIGKQGTQTRTFVAGIFGATAASGVGVIVNSSGQLGTVLSPNDSRKRSNRWIK